MHEKARPHPESDRHVVCPVCETACDSTSPLRLCTGCGTAFDVAPSGDVLFDLSRKADRQEVAEAVAGSEQPAAKGLEGSARRRPVGLGKKTRRA